MNNQVINDKLKKAAIMLEKSAAEISSLRDDNKNLSIDNARLKLSVIASERSGRAKDLANMMFAKGMISKNDVLNKAKEIMEYNDEAFEALKTAVEKNAQSSSPESSFIESSEIDKEATIKSVYNRDKESRNLVAEKINTL